MIITKKEGNNWWSSLAKRCGYDFAGIRAYLQWWREVFPSTMNTLYKALVRLSERIYCGHFPSIHTNGNSWSIRYSIQRWAEFELAQRFSWISLHSSWLSFDAGTITILLAFKYNGCCQASTRGVEGPPSVQYSHIDLRALPELFSQRCITVINPMTYHPTVFVGWIAAYFRWAERAAQENNVREMTKPRQKCILLE